MLRRLSGASNNNDVIEWWGRYRPKLRGASLIFSVPRASPFGNRVKSRFGTGAEVISAFAYDGYFFLNDRIFEDIRRGKKSDIKVSYLMSFDCNAASHVRALLRGIQGSSALHDMRELMLHFGGNHFNWQILPYLLETSVQSEDQLTSQAVFETVLAATRLEDIDTEHFLKSGRLRQRTSDAAIYDKARNDLRRFQSNLALCQPLKDLWQSIYVCVLKCAVLELSFPGPRYCAKKMIKFVEFMHEHLRSMMTTLLKLAYLWFHSAPEAGLFSPLSGTNPNLVKKAKNIAWDIYHLMRLPQECIQPNDADFLIPYFLTFDQKLARLMKVCGLKLCLIQPDRNMPFSVQDVDIGPVLNFLSSVDLTFSGKYFTVDAHRSRAETLASGWQADLDGLMEKYEMELAGYEQNVSSG